MDSMGRDGTIYKLTAATLRKMGSVRGLTLLWTLHDLRDDPLPLSHADNYAPEATALLFWQVSMV